jgi:hypothetical protein
LTEENVVPEPEVRRGSSDKNHTAKWVVVILPIHPADSVIPMFPIYKAQQVCK